METPLYLRARGRVLGPFDHDKLQAMVRRGQLSRMHELSTDSVSWVRASTYPELFAIETDAVTAQPAGRDTALSGSPSPLLVKSATGGRTVGAQSDAAADDNAAIWYYSLGGKQAGPVDFPTVRALASSGQLTQDHLIWSEGMTEWQVAKTVPGLSWKSDPSAAEFSTTSNRRPDNSSQSPELSEQLARAAFGSRGWVLFIAIVIIIVAALMGVGGVMLLAQGARLRAPSVVTSQAVTSGILSLLTAVVVMFGGYLLLNFASRLGGLRYSRAPILMERALDALRIFWLYAGICLIVCLVFVVIIAIAGIANL